MEDSTFPFPKLPNELIIEILTWLPVKPLLKFKSVCKSWQALISSQRFAKSHLENSKSDPNLTARRLLLQFRGNFKQLSANSILHEPVSEAFDLSPPFHLDGRVKEVLGSCNGLLLLAAKFPIPGNASDERVELILWNPSTRIRRDLPDTGLDAYPAGALCTVDYGFGYDKSSDDYKVVRFFRGHMDPSKPEAMLQVYSLRNDAWKAAKPFGEHYCEMSNPATFVNGKLYWIGSRVNDSDDEGEGEDGGEDEWFLFSFDLETEEYETLRFPNCVRFDHYLWLGEYGGSLRVMCFHSVSSDVWSLERCGAGNGDWAKVVTFPRLRDFWWFPICVLYVMNSPVLFLADGPIAISDAKGCSVRYHEIRNMGDLRVCRAYIESLVTPLG